MTAEIISDFHLVHIVVIVKAAYFVDQTLIIDYFLHSFYSGCAISELLFSLSAVLEDVLPVHFILLFLVIYYYIYFAISMLMCRTYV